MDRNLTLSTQSSPRTLLQQAMHVSFPRLQRNENSRLSQPALSIGMFHTPFQKGKDQQIIG